MTKMSETMTKAYEQMLADYDKAKSAKCFGEWYAGSEERYEDWLIKRTAALGERRVRQMVKSARGRYELALSGIVETDASYATIGALERRGLVESADRHGVYAHAVKLLEA